MKKRLLASLLAVGLLGLCGCEMVSVNRDRDKAQVVVKIGETEYTKADVYQAAYEDLMANGYDIDLWDETLDESTREALDDYLVEFLDAFAEQKLIDAVCQAEYPFTEEEEASIQEDVDSYMDFVKMMLGYDETNPDAYEGDIEADVDDYLDSMGTSRVTLETTARSTKAYAKVHDAMTEGVEATEEQVQQRYNTDLQSQKDAYATGGRTEYETAITGDSLGDYILFKPKDYAVVKHILLMYTDQDNEEYQAVLTTIEDAEGERDTVQAAYDDAKTKVDSAQAALTQAQAELELAQQNNDEAAISEYQTTISVNNEIVNTQTAEMNAQAALLVKMDANVQDANDELTAKKAQMLSRYQAKVDEIMARINDGESFDVLMAEYNDDGGADSGSIGGLGYVVSPQTPTYYDEFETVAFAMTQRGQISDPIVTQAGVHILFAVYVTGEEVDIPYEIVKDAVKAAEDATVIEDAWQAKLVQIKEEYGGESWPKRIKFVQ